MCKKIKVTESFLKEYISNSSDKLELKELESFSNIKDHEFSSQYKKTIEDITYNFNKNPKESYIMNKKFIITALVVGLISVLGATTMATEYMVRPPQLSTDSLSGDEAMELQKQKILKYNPDWYEGKQWTEVYEDGSSIEITLDEWLLPYTIDENGNQVGLLMDNEAFRVTNEDDIAEMDRYAEESAQHMEEIKLGIELQTAETGKPPKFEDLEYIFDGIELLYVDENGEEIIYILDEQLQPMVFDQESGEYIHIDIPIPTLENKE